MKKNDKIVLKIEDVFFPNKGVGYIEQQKVIVKNTLPQQKVLACVTKKRSGAIEARLEEVLIKSPFEQQSACPHFALCGGCTYQNMKREAELAMKEKQVKTLLQQAQIKIESWEGIVPSPKETAYRNKCEFSFGDEQKDGALALGMRKRQSYYEVVTLTDCNIVDKDYLSIIDATLAFFQKRNVAFYHKMRHDGTLRHLVVRKGEATGEILVNLVTSSEVNFSLEEYKQTLLSLQLEGNICGILHTKNDGIADVVKSDQTVILYGRNYFIEKLFELEFKISAFSFFQTNSKGAEKLYSIVKEFAGDIKNKVVFDLYCGTGTIGQIMAKHSKKVIGIELVEEAVEADNENAKRNGLTNCEFIAGDVLKKVEELKEKPDFIIVDPPRDGIHPKAIDKIIAFDAPEIVYVSCKPTSLARDLQLFQQAGYQIKRVKLMDMFPRTVHVETVVSLVRKIPDDYIHVKLDLDDLDLTASEAKATYSKIKEYVLKQYGLKVSSLYIAQIKEKYCIIERENYNLPKTEGNRVPKCPKEKEDAIVDALKHFKMI